MRIKRSILSASCVLFSLVAFTQIQFSIATDLSGMHSFNKGQRFSTAGQTVITHFHVTLVDGAYIWYGYSAPGLFKSNFTAVAKLPATNPQMLDFRTYSHVSFHTISIGWKHYLKGTYNAEGLWNLYFTAGFGLVGGKVRNTYTIAKDTSRYIFPANPVDGIGRFKRLTFDVGLGSEIPIGMDIFLYGEIRAWIPASDYPSNYLLVNDNAPFIGSANIGLRILFD